MISKEEIITLYDKFIRVNYTEGNKSKYSPLPFALNNKKYKWESMDISRVISLLEFREYVMANNFNFKEVLSFNGETDPEFEYFKYKRCYTYSYEKNEIYDLHYLDIEKKDFDFAMLNNTVEHLYNPILAIKNIYNHLKVGGIFYAVGPVNNIPHCDPFHFYTGITPMGLIMMMRLAGFDILKAGLWGNKEYQKQMFDKIWSNYTFSKDPGHNDFDCPLTTWCWAIKNK